MSHSSVLVAVDPTDNVQKAVEFQMAPFDENLAGEWFGDGSRWDWWQIGGRYEARLLGKDIIRRADVDLNQMRLDEIERYTTHWHKSQRYAGEAHYEFITGIEPGVSVEDYVQSKVKTGFPWFGAFLKDRTWHEHERLGWFGGSVKTECEIRGAETHVCLFENKNLGSKIYSWQGNESWDDIFFKRFVEGLAPETLLVCVDYHV